MSVSRSDRDPVLLVALPERSTPAIRILFPEHVTVRRQGQPEHLYRFDEGAPPVQWHRNGNAVEYERDLPHGIHMLARATLADDGVLFHYEFANRSGIAYDMITALTDPRMQSVFHDPRLERTYVHGAAGFALLAERPVSGDSRYLASFRWPVPQRLVERRDDGITYVNRSRPVDEPLIATLSSDRTWIVASFARDAGNVWSNPALTCQHVDREIPLPAHATAVAETKMLVMRGSLDDARRREVAERSALR